VFLLPFDLVTGGVSGYSIVIKTFLPFEFITKELIIAVVTWTLFLIGLIVLGKGFAMKSLISTIFYPIATAVFSNLRSPDFMNGFFPFYYIRQHFFRNVTDFFKIFKFSKNYSF
jgi:uncharacterized membrane-anchored protein YitT (DUF2179 family)